MASFPSPSVGPENSQVRGVSLLKRKFFGLPIWAWLGLGLVVLGALANASGVNDPDSEMSVTPASEPESAETGSGNQQSAVATDESDGEETVAEAADPTTVATPKAPEESSETTSQSSARRSAESYLDFMAFSRSGLIEQLEFEGFSTEDATYGVDAQGADWNEQAAKSAKAYLDLMGFSRSGLIEQLVFEGFTQAEAEFGATAVGL